MTSVPRVAPIPIVDNLEHIGNPFQLKPATFKNRMPAHITIDGAVLDYEYALKFLYSYNGSTATFNAYRRDIERLLQWTWLVNQTCVLSLQREDIEAFINFCLKPPQTWISDKNLPRFIDKDGERIPNRVCGGRLWSRFPRHSFATASGRKKSSFCLPRLPLERRLQRCRHFTIIFCKFRSCQLTLCR